MRWYQSIGHFFFFFCSSTVFTETKIIDGQTLYVWFQWNRFTYCMELWVRFFKNELRWNKSRFTRTTRALLSPHPCNDDEDESMKSTAFLAEGLSAMVHFQFLSFHKVAVDRKLCFREHPFYVLRNTYRGFEIFRRTAKTFRVPYETLRSY